MESGEPQHFMTTVSASTISGRPWVFLTLSLRISLPSSGLKREHLFSCPPAQISDFIHPLLFPYLFSFLISLSNFFSVTQTYLPQVLNLPPSQWPEKHLRPVLLHQQDCKYEHTQEKLTLYFMTVFSLPQWFSWKSRTMHEESQLLPTPADFSQQKNCGQLCHWELCRLSLKKTRQGDNRKNGLIQQSR